MDLGRDTKQCLDTVMNFYVSFIPFFAHGAEQAISCCRIGIFLGDFHSLFRWFDMRDDRDFMAMLARRTSAKKLWFLRFIGLAKIVRSPNAIFSREPILDLFVPGKHFG